MDAEQVRQFLFSSDEDQNAFMLARKIEPPKPIVIDVQERIILIAQIEHKIAVDVKADQLKRTKVWLAATDFDSLALTQEDVDLFGSEIIDVIGQIINEYIVPYENNADTRISRGQKIISVNPKNENLTISTLQITDIVVKLSEGWMDIFGKKALDKLSENIGSDLVDLIKKIVTKSIYLQTSK